MRAVWVAVMTVAMGVLASIPAGAAKYPFVGTWDCEIAIFTFTDKYQATRFSTERSVYKSVAPFRSGFLITFSDGGRWILTDITASRMTWFSVDSQDQYPCKKVK